MKTLPRPLLVLSLLLGFFSLNACAPTETKGQKLNDVFPKDQAGYDVVFTSEKAGYSQATLKHEGQDVAQLSVTDLLEDEESKAKYAQSTDKVGGYPAVARGSQGTAILVADRYQVQVRSQSDAFNEAARKEWLAKFDLNRLASLK